MFYTYLWLREDGTPYYVGKGTGNRAFESDGHKCRRPKCKEDILLQRFSTEENAFEAEKFLIAYYGRADKKQGCLRNLTDGGEGVSVGSPRNSGSFIKGVHVSVHTEIKKGERRSPETEFQKGHAAHNKGKEGLRGHLNPFFGKTHTSESLEKMRNAHLGKKASDETRLKMSIARGGWRHGTSTAYSKYKCRCELCRQWRHNAHLRTGH